MVEIRYVNGVHFSAVLENTALIQGIRWEPLGEHLIPWTCAVFFLTALKWTPFVFSHTTVQLFQQHKKVYSGPTWQTTIRWWIADAQSTAFTCYTACTYSIGPTCNTAECGIGWYRHTSHSENTASECDNACLSQETLCGHHDNDLQSPTAPAHSTHRVGQSITRIPFMGYHQNYHPRGIGFLRWLIYTRQFSFQRNLMLIWRYNTLIDIFL